MDGRVLHFDEAADGGLIRGSDGGRYPFRSDAWRAAELPTPGDSVDFEVVDGLATEIFRVHAAQAAPTEPPEDVAAYLRRRPALIPASVILIGCVAPFFNVPFVSMSLLGLPSTASFFLNLATAFGGGAGAAELGGIRAAIWSLYLLYLIPAAAGWLALRELAGSATRRQSLAVGIIGLVTPFATAAISTAILAATLPDRPRRPAANADLPNGPESVVQILSYIGIGWILIIAASVALIAIGCGWRPFGGATQQD